MSPPDPAQTIERLRVKRRYLVATGVELKAMGISDWGIRKQVGAIDERVLRLREAAVLVS